MKTAELKTFLEDVLVADGAEVVESQNHLLRVKADEALTEKLGVGDLSLAFNSRGLESDPNSELATVGNPVFDRILELASDQGRIGVRYAPVPRKAVQPNPGKALELADNLALADPRSTYLPTVYHLFKIEWSVEETPDSLEVVPVDAASLDGSRPAPDLAALWDEMDREPETGRDVPGILPVADEILSAGLAGLERRLRRRIGRLRRSAEQHLATEEESIGSYYQNLIEETRSSKRRYAGGAEAKEEKIRILQLDWKRRMEEAREFWQPKVEVELTGLGIVLYPTLEYPVLGEGKPLGSIHYDLTSGLFLVPSDVRGVTLLG